MNDGRNTYQRVPENRLPFELQADEGYRAAPSAAQVFWYGYEGRFSFESTTEIYDTPVRDVYRQLARLAGPDELISHAQSMLELDQPLHAIHLAEIAMAAQPDHRDALAVYLRAHRVLLARCHQSNDWRKHWLQGTIDATLAKLKAGDAGK